MNRLGFSCGIIDGNLATYERKIGDPAVMPLYPTVKVKWFLNDNPTYVEAVAEIIKASIEAQQRRAKRALGVITGDRS